jgi:hypothetical protein
MPANCFRPRFPSFPHSFLVIPAKAGIQGWSDWIPAFAGMTVPYFD